MRNREEKKRVGVFFMKKKKVGVLYVFQKLLES